MELAPSEALSAGNSADVFDEHEKVTVVRRGRHKPEMLVECRCRSVFCMNGKRAYPAISATCRVRSKASRSSPAPMPRPCHSLWTAGRAKTRSGIG